MTDLPNHLTPEQVKRYAQESATLFEFTQKARVGREPAKRLLNNYGMRDEVQTGSADSFKV
mgnify:CR=1 FL=1